MWGGSQKKKKVRFVVVWEGQVGNEWDGGGGEQIFTPPTLSSIRQKITASASVWTQPGQLYIYN